MKTWELLEENTNKQANGVSYKDMGIIRRECRAVFNQKECTDTDNKNQYERQTDDTNQNNLNKITFPAFIFHH